MQRFKFFAKIIVVFLILSFPALVFADDFVLPTKLAMEPFGVRTAFNYETQTIKSQRVYDITISPFFSGEEKDKKFFLVFPALNYQFIKIDNDDTQMIIHRFYVLSFGQTDNELTNSWAVSLFAPEFIELKYRETDKFSEEEWKLEDKFGFVISDAGFRYVLFDYFLAQLQPLSIGIIEQGNEVAFQWYILPRIGFKFGDLKNWRTVFALGPEFLWQGEDGPYYDFQEKHIGGFAKVWVRIDNFSNLRLLGYGGKVTKSEWKKDQGEFEYDGYYGGGTIMLVF